MPASKATPKAEITLVSKDDAGWKFAHSPSGMGNFSVKQKLGKKVTLGVGFTVSTSGQCPAAPAGTDHGACRQSRRWAGGCAASSWQHWHTPDVQKA